MVQHELFEDCPEGQERLEQELREAARAGAKPWWDTRYGEWYGQLFAFWSKTSTIRCEEIKFDFREETYDSARFAVSPSWDAPRPKACIVSKSSFHADDPFPSLRCVETNWGFAHDWVQSHTDELLSESEGPSVFGIEGRTAFPSVAGTHSTIVTSDGALLLCLRSGSQAYYPVTWSASFEESVSAGLGGDKTLAETIMRGAKEEFGLTPADVARSTCTAVGREFVRDSEGTLQLNMSVLAAVELNLNLAGLWERLSQTRRAQDSSEHTAWIAIRFSGKESMWRLLRSARTNGLDIAALSSDPDISLDVHPRSDTSLERHPLMPTSAPRLFLTEEWLRHSSEDRTASGTGRKSPAPTIASLTLLQEGLHLERKAAALVGHGGERQPKRTTSVLETVVAFLNTEGGTVLIGVADDGTIVGIEKDLSAVGQHGWDGWSNEMTNHLRDRIGPDVGASVKIRSEKVKGHLVAALDCPAYDRPVDLKRVAADKDWLGHDHRMYVRLDASDHALGPKQAVEYSQRRWPS
jgi:hypothetical protein